MPNRPIRLLTANLLNGRADPAALARLLREREIDVAALQELGDEQAAAVAEVLPFGKLEPADDYNGMGIALRRPAEVRRLPLRFRDARVTELSPAEWPSLAAPLEVMNLHIQPPHSLPPWASLLRRRDQLRAVAAYLAAVPRDHRVVAGDLNATPRWPVYRQLAALVPDAVERHAREQGHRPPLTWGPWPGAPRLLRIDHVLAHGVRVVHCETVAIRGSDHHGVLVEVLAEE